MLEKPVFKPHFHVEAIPKEGLFLLTEHGHTVLTGRLYECVVPLINGSRSSDDISDSLTDTLSPAEVYYTLNLLEAKGYVIEGKDLTFSGTTAFWTADGIDPAAAVDRLKQKTVSVSSFGNFPVEPFYAVLKQQEIQISEEGEFGVVLTDEYLRTDLDAYNQKCLKQKKPWMIIKPVGLEIFIGPIFIPQKTGCWQCLRDRYILNREVERFVMEKKGRKEPFTPSKANTPATLQTAYGIAAQEIANWIVKEDEHPLKGKMISMDTRTWRTTHHALTRRPQCPVCGEQRGLKVHRAPEPIQLQPAKAAFTKDGGYRTRIPEETIENYEHLISPVTGIVNLLERDARLDSSVHVYMAGHNFAMRHDNLASLKDGLRNMSAGKGVSEVQAKASGLCEAIERMSGVFEGYENRMTASFSELGSQAIHPNDCMLYSDKQYQNRKVINDRKSNFNFVPESYDNHDLKIEWTPVWSLTDETFKYLPTQYLYYGYIYPDGNRDPVYAMACSNGAASGNSLEEAILQGFFELVERDSVALWWYNMRQPSGVEIASFAEPYFVKLADYYRKMNRKIWLLDITSDLGIPAFAALSHRTDQEAEHIILGFGCHLDAGLAAQRALTEMNQSFPHVLSVFNEDGTTNPNFGDTEAVNWWKNATCLNQPYLMPNENREMKCQADYSRDYSEDILENIQLCQKIVEEQGMEMLVLDQSRPDISAPVAKVIVPGLRHFWARFAPGRLYDVPVALGWLERPLEEELNPIPIFM